MAYRAVSEFGLSASVGPLAVASMGGGDEGSLMLKDSGAPNCRNHYFTCQIDATHCIQSGMKR